MTYEKQIPNPKSFCIPTFICGEYYITVDTDMNYYVQEWKKEGGYGPFKEETQALKFLIKYLIKEVEKCSNN
jgi:hypothetical protein